MFYNWLILANWFKPQKNKTERCTKPCGNPLCAKVGCLNTTMKSNALRLQILVNRLEEYGYKFPIRVEVESTETEATKIPINKNNVVEMSDYRKDES